MKAIFCFILFLMDLKFEIVSCSCNLGIGRSHPDQIPVHELYQRIVALRGEEKLAMLFRYIPPRSVQNVNITYVQFYVDLTQCSFDINTPVGLNHGFQVRFYSPEPVLELTGNATIYGVSLE